jgi:hypothetical protein
MHAEGKSPLDHGREAAGGRAARFVRIEREAGAVPGAREMALTRRPRSEDPALRAQRFHAVERTED